MKKSIYVLLMLSFGVFETNAQEIKIKRQFLNPVPEYYAGEKYIGDSPSELIMFIKNNSKDTILIQHLNESERLSKIYPKIYLYSACTVGAGGLGLAYVFINGVGSILNPSNVNPGLATVARVSIGFMITGLVGLTVGQVCFISSQIKLRKAIKGYNNGLQPSLSFEMHPFVAPDFSAGLSLRVRF